MPRLESATRSPYPALGAAMLFAIAWLGLNSRLINVVNYESVDISAPQTPASVAIPIAVIALLLVTALARRIHTPMTVIPPLFGLVVLAAMRFWGRPLGFLEAVAAAVLAGWSLQQLTDGLTVPRALGLIDRSAPAILGVSIMASTVWHAAAQVNLWHHFSLGYADIGFFTTELEYCLPWKDVPERFADTRMGYHCIPFFYALAPFYALIRSPVFLMAVGPFALNLAAIPFYQLARHRGASRGVATLIGLGWLALPSVSRLPYANTYGFQSIYLAVPWLAFAWSFALRDRWRASHVCLVAAMLCEETVCGAAFGWGCYLVLFTARRRTGAVVAAMALGYLAFCTTIIIPHFADSSDYSRLRLFGDLTFANVLERLLRPRVGLYVVALLAPLLLGLCRSRAALKLLVISAPTLLIVLLVQNDDYLNIKYWHQSSVLPALFLAAVVGVCGPREGSQGAIRGEGQREPRGTGILPLKTWAGSPCHESCRGLPGLLVAVLLLHQLLGFSPLTQAYRPYAADPNMQSPDPRMDAVTWIRARYPRETTTVLATERMAAHFCDYRAVYPMAALAQIAPPPAGLIVLDRIDRWDSVLREHGPNRIIEESRRHGYETAGEFGSVVILHRSAH